MAKNEDGFEAGKPVSNDELYKHLSQQRLKPAAKKKLTMAKAEKDDASDD